MIEVHDRNLTLRVNSEEVKFNISNATRFPEECSTCIKVDIVTLCMEDVMSSIAYSDPLGRCLSTLLSKGDIAEINSIVDTEVVDNVFALEVLKEVKKKAKIE